MPDLFDPRAGHEDDPLTPEERAVLFDGDGDAATSDELRQQISDQRVGQLVEGPSGTAMQWNPETFRYDIPTTIPNSAVGGQAEATGTGDLLNNSATGTVWERNTEGIWIDTGVPFRQPAGGGVGTAAIELQQAQAELELTNARITQIQGDIAIATRNLDIAEAQGDEQNALRERERLDRLQGDLENASIRRAELTATNIRFQAQLGLETAGLTEQARQFDVGLTEGARQFDVSTGLTVEELNQRESQFARDLGELSRQFDLSTAEGQRQFDNAMQAREAEFARTMAVDIQQFQASLSEQGRQFDVQTNQQARQFAAQLGLNYDQLVADINEGNANRLLTFAVAQGDLDAQRALMDFQSAETSRDRTLALANLQAADERSRQQQIQSVARDLAEFAQSPGDLNALFAFQTAIGAGPAPLTEAIGRGETAITDQSLQPAAINLALLEALSEPSQFLQDVQAFVQSQSELPDRVELDVDPASLVQGTPAPPDLASIADVALGTAPAPAEALSLPPPPELQAAAAITPSTAETSAPAPIAVPESTPTSLSGTAQAVAAPTDIAAGGIPDSGFVTEPGDGGGPAVNPNIALGPGTAGEAGFTAGGTDDGSKLVRQMEAAGFVGVDDNGDGIIDRFAIPDDTTINLSTGAGTGRTLSNEPATGDLTTARPVGEGTVISSEPEGDPSFASTFEGTGIAPPTETTGGTAVSELSPELRAALGLAHGGVALPGGGIQRTNPNLAMPDPRNPGIARTAQAIVGDAQQPGVVNPELVTDLPGDGFAVTPLNQLPRLAQGGIAGSPDADAARNFLLNIANQLIAANPVFAQVPAPVSVSAPGTPVEVQEAAAGIAATATGIPTGAFERERARLTPRGVEERIIQRVR